MAPGRPAQGAQRGRAADRTQDRAAGWHQPLRRPAHPRAQQRSARCALGAQPAGRRPGLRHRAGGGRQPRRAAACAEPGGAGSRAERLGGDLLRRAWRGDAAHRHGLLAARRQPRRRSGHLAVQRRHRQPHRPHRRQAGDADLRQLLRRHAGRHRCGRRHAGAGRCTADPAGAQGCGGTGLGWQRAGGRRGPRRPLDLRLAPDGPAERRGQLARRRPGVRARA